MIIFFGVRNITIRRYCDEQTTGSNCEGKKNNTGSKKRACGPINLEIITAYSCTTAKLANRKFSNFRDYKLS